MADELLLPTITSWLLEQDAARLELLWQAADKRRKEWTGDAVHLRGLVEISNHCRRRCAYCGISAGRSGLSRYRLSEKQIIACADKAVELGFGSLVLQGGEDPVFTADKVIGLVRAIKKRHPALAITLSLGERGQEELASWRCAGADRYLLRFETSNPVLYKKLHPEPWASLGQRLDMLRSLGELGYEVGSGVMTGLPGQSIDDLAADLLLFRKLKLDMIGLGPYIEHPDTALSRESKWLSDATPEPCPKGILMAWKAIALARLLCPWANIPATTAIATLDKTMGLEAALSKGANILMPNLTPPEYRAFYEIYPAKHCIKSESDDKPLLQRLSAIGRYKGSGPGNAKPPPAVLGDDILKSHLDSLFFCSSVSRLRASCERCA